MFERQENKKELIRLASELSGVRKHNIVFTQMSSKDRKDFTTMTNDSVLEELVASGKISIDDVQRLLAEMHFENFIKENHPYDIWLGSDGRWKTYVFDESRPNKRRLVAMKSKKKLLEYLLDTFEGKTKLTGTATIRQLFPLWLEHKKLMSADTYIPRIKSDWKKYYEDNPIVDQPLGSINKLQLENWLLHLIRDNKMTKNCYYNVSMIMRQIFEFAFESECISDNPFLRVKKDLGKLFRRVEKPQDETQVYTDEEIGILEPLIWSDFHVAGRKIYRLAPLAVLFQLYTALRVSEVCVLKYSDILSNNKLHVQRMLARDTGDIRDHTKGFVGERTIYLTEKARLIIDMTLAFRKEMDISCSEYIFSTSDTPIPWRTINEYLERYCSRANIPYRSSHKLRKTALSSMVNSGISLNAVKSFAGHVDEETTLKYYTFDREGEVKRNEQIEKALSFGQEQ